MGNRIRLRRVEKLGPMGVDKLPIDLFHRSWSLRFRGRQGSMSADHWIRDKRESSRQSLDGTKCVAIPPSWKEFAVRRFGIGEPSSRSNSNVASDRDPVGISSQCNLLALRYNTAMAT
jgi:hypothetical protein